MSRTYGQHGRRDEPHYYCCSMMDVFESRHMKWLDHRHSSGPDAPNNAPGAFGVAAPGAVWNVFTRGMFYLIACKDLISDDLVEIRISQPVAVTPIVVFSLPDD